MSSARDELQRRLRAVSLPSADVAVPPGHARLSRCRARSAVGQAVGGEDPARRDLWPSPLLLAETDAGLDTILTLHFAQEDEALFTSAPLLDTAATSE